MFPEERRQQILDLLGEKNKVSVDELCQLFDVSSVTIRKDLQLLDEANKLTRTHGGALPRQQASFEHTFAEKEGINTDNKAKIARVAATFIEPGDTVAIDSGSTTLEFTKAIATIEDLTVITNDIRIISYLETYSSAFVICVGGRLRRGRSCLIGSIANENLSRFTVDKCFIGAESFSIQKGFTTPNIDQADWKQHLIDVAPSHFVLLDSTKIGKQSLVNFAHLDDIRYLIVDDEIDEEDVEEIRRTSLKTKLIIAD